MKKISKFIAMFVVIAVCFCLLTACEKAAPIPENELALLTEDLVPRANDDVVRIMSANVLVHIASWGGEPVISRADRFARAVKHYQPDVIGAQEFCSEWYSKFMPMIEDGGYKIIKEKYNLFVENRSPIIYNENKLNLIDHGILRYSQGDDNGCRVITWAVFERKSDGDRFAVTSTHFNLIRQGRETEELSIMNTQVDEMFSTIQWIEQEYGCPVFMCGDYNSMEEREMYYETEYYGEVAKSSAACEIYNRIAEKYVDLKYVDGIAKYDVGGGILPNGAWDSPSWDHIFASGAGEVKAFAVLSSLYFQRYEDWMSRISDHLPIFADIAI